MQSPILQDPLNDRSFSIRFKSLDDINNHITIMGI
jgi:hypothetical protein